MANTSLSKVFGTSTDEKKWTLSVWIKHSGTNGQEHIMFSNAGGNSNTGWFQIQISGNKLNLNGYNTTWLTSTQYLRDVSSWYHLVVTADSTAAAANRLKAYINGQEITSWSTNNVAGSTSSNQTWGINMSGTNYIGAEGSGGANGFNGSMSHLNFIDGTVYLPSAFGETDTTTGEWKGKTSPSVTYGNNGFFIFKDGNGITDQSGKGNNWTVANGTLTTLKDNPDNNFATMNPLDVSLPSTFVLSNGNLNTLLNGYSSSGGGNYPRAFSNLQVTSGKWYVECKIIEEGDSGIIGISARSGISLINVGGTNYDWLGINAHDYRYYHDGTKMNNNSSSSYGTTWDGGDIIGIALDMDNLAIYFSLNGVWQNSGDPTSGSSRTNAAFNLTAVDSTPNGAYKFGFGTQGDGNNCQAVWNFGNGYFGTTAITTNSGNGYSGAEGSSKFNYTVPTGYSALSTKGLNE